MPRTIGANLQTHIEGGATTLALCWKLTLVDSTVLGFTSHTEDLLIGGVTYEASTGLTPEAIEARVGAGVDNLDVMGILSDANITEQDIHAGVYDYALVEVFLVNYADVSMGTIVLSKGRIGDVHSSAGAFKAEVRSLLQHASQRIVGLVSVNCRVKKFGDSECQASLASPVTQTGTVDTVASRKSFTGSVPSPQASGYYAFGLLTWTTGANAGRSMEVKSSDGSDPTGFVLQQAMRSDIQVGDGFTVVAGCDRRFETCRDKWNNIVNFRGEPHVPGTDYLLQSPRP